MTIRPSPLTPTLSPLGRGSARCLRWRWSFRLLRRWSGCRWRGSLPGSPFSPRGRKWGCGGSGAGLLLNALPRAGSGGLHVLAFLRHYGDELVDRHVIGAFRHHDLGHDAVIDGFVFHGRLVGLDLGDDVAGLDRVAFLLEPLGEIALLHRGRQRRHEDVDGHGATISPKI